MPSPQPHRLSGRTSYSVESDVAMCAAFLRLISPQLSNEWSPVLLPSVRLFVENATVLCARKVENMSDHTMPRQGKPQDFVYIAPRHITKNPVTCCGHRSRSSLLPTLTQRGPLRTLRSPPHPFCPVTPPVSIPPPPPLNAAICPSPPPSVRHRFTLGLFCRIFCRVLLV